MRRRSFLSQAVVGAGAGVIAVPAVAQSLPAVTWRLASSFPKTLDTIFGAADVFTKRVAQLTGGRFQIRALPAARSCPACRCSTRCRPARSKWATRRSYYYFGKDPAFAFDCACRSA